MKYLKSISKKADGIDYILLDVGAKFRFNGYDKGKYTIGVFTAGQYFWLFDNHSVNVNPDKFMNVIADIPDRKIIDANEVLKLAGEI